MFFIRGTFDKYVSMHNNNNCVKIKITRNHVFTSKAGLQVPFNIILFFSVIIDYT